MCAAVSQHFLPSSRSEGVRAKNGRRPLYLLYNSMINRCHNPRNADYRHYGGRGISVYWRWRRDYWEFEEWINESLGLRPECKHGKPGCRRCWSIDRIDNDGNYEPGNLRWATPQEQSLNQRHRNQHTNSTSNRSVE